MTTPCRDPAKLLLDWYANGSLRGEEQATVASHLEACAACRRELRILRSIRSSLAAREASPAPGADRVASRPGVRRRWLGAAAAAAALAVAGGVLWMAPGRPPRPPASGETPTIDLGSGPRRGSAAAPSFDLPRDASRVAIVFRVPAEDASPSTCQIVDRSTGEVLAERPAPPPDAVGRRTLLLDRTILGAGGEFQLLVRTEERAGEAVVAYPFRVPPAPGPPPGR